MVLSMALDGFSIALERIAREAEEKTGFLDLGRLGLTTLPDALFGLSHLRRLNLGEGYWDETGRWIENGTIQQDNSIDLAQLKCLPSLQWLNCAGTELTN